MYIFVIHIIKYVIIIYHNHGVAQALKNKIRDADAKFSHAQNCITYLREVLNYGPLCTQIIRSDIKSYVCCWDSSTSIFLANKRFISKFQFKSEFSLYE